MVAFVWAALAVGCGGDGGEDGAGAWVAPEAGRALVTAGLAAVGAEAETIDVTAERRGALLRLRVSELPDQEGLLSVLPLFELIHARIEPFCPSPGILRCKPALRASGTPRSEHAARRVAAALRRLAARTYGVTPLVRRRGDTTNVVTANGELLAAVRVRGEAVLLSFGGLSPPRHPVPAQRGRLVLHAGPAALAAMRGSLSGAALRALSGARRLSAMSGLPR